MARPVAAYGRPGYGPLVGEGWADRIAPVVEQTYTSVIKIALADTYGDYDEETHSRPEIPGVVLYEGPGRIQSIGAGDEASVDLAGQQVTITRYRVQFPRTVQLAPIGTTVVITDPSLSIYGRSSIKVTITAYTINSLRFESVLLAELNQG